MIEISFSDSFKRAFKKRIKGNDHLEKKFREKLEQFKNNPFDTALKTHKLSGKLKHLWSFSIEYDQRVLYRKQKKAIMFGVLICQVVHLKAKQEKKPLRISKMRSQII
jgi:addiction module RelE/StbE family toxin